MKVLIVHGWLHSASIYKRLKHDLENKGHNVIIYNLPGFGGIKPIRCNSVLSDYAALISGHINNENYDCVIAHSMGGSIILRAIQYLDNAPKIILVSPEYGGIRYLKPIALIALFGYPVLGLIQRIDSVITSMLIKIVSLFTINSWSSITDNIIVAVRNADTKTAIQSFVEIVYDKFRVTSDFYSNIVLIYSDADRVISERSTKMLCNDIHEPKVYKLYGIGHTAVLEAYDTFLSIISKELCDDKEIT